MPVSTAAAWITADTSSGPHTRRVRVPRVHSSRELRPRCVLLQAGLSSPRHLPNTRQAEMGTEVGG